MTDADGHSRSANWPIGAFVTIDPKKLGLDGRELLGELKALSRWVTMFDSMKAHTNDVQERVFLGEVVQALKEDTERVQTALAGLAMSRGAGRMHDVPEDAKAN